MATNLNILQSSVEVSSAEDSIVITNNNTGNVVNVTGTDVTTVEVSSAGLLGNPGRDSDVLLGNSVYFANITASGNISASGTLSIPGFPNVSSSLASAVGSGADNLGNHTATQDLNLDGNSIFGILHTTASGNISASGLLFASSSVGNYSDVVVQDLTTGRFYTTSSAALTTTLPSGLLSSSAQIATDISGAFTEVSASLATDITTNTDNITILNSSGLLSSSAQIATDISGAFTNTSASLAANITTNADNIAILNSSGLLSSSAQIATDISGAFTSTSASIAIDIATNSASIATNTNNINTLTNATGSYALEANISGAFTSTSASIATDITTNSSSIAINTTNISTLTSATGSYALEANISGAFTSTSASIATDIAANSVSIADLTSATGSYLLNTTDTLTGDLTVTGTITAQEFHTEFVSASIIFTSGSTQFGNSADDIHTFSGSINVKDNGHITASGNISSSGTATFNALVAAGLTYPTTDGDDGNVLMTDGAGGLTLQSNVNYVNVKNVHGDTLAKGTPVHATGTSGNTPEVIAASSSVAASMPATFVLAEQLTNGSEGRAILSGFLNGLNTSNGFTEGDVLYVGPDGGYTPDKPTGTNLIQNIAIVGKIDASNGSIFVYGSGRSNDTQNLLENHIFYGSGSNQQYQLHISGALDSTVINNITASGDISASGDLSITGESFFGNHITASGNIGLPNNNSKITFGSPGTSYLENNLSNIRIVKDNIQALTFSTTLGTLFSNIDVQMGFPSADEVNLKVVGDLTVENPGLGGSTGNISASGNLVISNITASGAISASGTLNANLNSSAQTEIVYYNTSTGELTQGPINAVDGFIINGGTF